MRLDDRAERLVYNLSVERYKAERTQFCLCLLRPQEQFAPCTRVLEHIMSNLYQAVAAVILSSQTSRQLVPRRLWVSCAHQERDGNCFIKRLKENFERLMNRRAEAICCLEHLLDSYSYESMLRRGFTLIQDESDHVVEGRATAALSATTVSAAGWTAPSSTTVPVRVEATDGKLRLPSLQGTRCHNIRKRW
ncbi:hypothetical protein RIEGSTA812A_PEG_796 [invertebrate metagenome]|uniref:Uncharacterized protein n=1 Tax=invertebrate metagenome TaxID=1711999 RepID=A0A484H923_9ZZZZ